MKKIMFVALAAIMGFSTQVSAQITEGEPTAHKIRTGNRMEKGNWGLYMGVTSDMFKNWKDVSIDNEVSLPLLNVKYMMSDRFELRMGIQGQKTRQTVKGDLATSYNPDGSINETESVKEKNIQSNALLTPGFAYHFSKNNILDVYAGAELPLGWTRDKQVDNAEDDKFMTKHNSFDIGLGGFVGLQAFIGHLPLALGFEYGLSSVTHCGNRYITKVDNETQNYTYKQLEGNGARFKSLKNRGTELGSQFRITVSYYFK